MRSGAVWGGAILGAALFGLLAGTGASGVAVFVFALLGGLMVSAIGWSMRRPVDASWLPKWIVLGYTAKLAGTFARYYMVTEIYGIGDSYRYYRAGIEMAAEWRNGRVPSMSGNGAFGTQVVESVTGGLFAIVTPDMLGGFVLFAILAFLGQLMLYAAFRRHAAPHQLKPYAILIFVLPVYSFWPSSIGKDALVLAALGACAYFVARSLEGFQVRWLAGLGVSLTALGLIRVHVAGLVVAAFVLAALFTKSPVARDPAVAVRRLLVLGVGLVAGVVILSVFPDVFGVDILSSQDRDGFTADVFRRTSESGTVADGGPVTSPADIPAALAHVLYRPFVFEANEIQHFLAAGETFLLIALTAWRLPAMLRNWRSWRANGYVVFATFYTLGFSVAFSVVRNLGIIARQRGQVLAFFLAVIFVLGWEQRDEPEPQKRKLRLTPAEREAELARLERGAGDLYLPDRSSK